jgi:urease accessory protein
MSNATLLLSALQHGDSFFPSGAASFSWGLETLFTEGELFGADHVEAFVLAQLQGRWATFDRCVVAAAHKVSDDLNELCRIDTVVEAQTLASEMRDGSRRSGLALLRVHEKLETPGAAPYLDCVRASQAWGHLSIMQGFLWAQSGVTRSDAEAISAHALSVSLLGAALRLGAIGHIDSQRILGNLRRSIDEFMDCETLPIERVHAFTPHSEIAVMRHETVDSRLFAN